jgi:hypothetical protein
MPLPNTFTPVPGSPDPQSTGTQNLSVSGKFFDFKQDVQFDVEATLPQPTEYSTAIIEYEVSVDKISQNSPSDAKYYYFTPESTPDCNTSDSIIKKNIHGSFVKSTVANITSSDKGFNFQNGVTYALKHRVTIQKTFANNSSNPVKYVLGHVQNFTYYDTPLTFTDYSFDSNVQLGDTLSVSGLFLNPSDGTEPSKVKFKFNLYNSNNNDADIYFTSEHDYESLGSYNITLPSLQNPQGFVLGDAYVITAHGNWELGYSTSKSSSQLLYLLNRPKILNVNVLPLSVNSSAFDAGTWTNSNVAQLGGSGAPTLLGSSNTTNKTGSWSFSQATWVSTSNSNGTRTDTYTGSTLTSSSYTGPVTITTTYGVDANDLPNTDIQFSIINQENRENQAVIFSYVTLLSSIVPNSTNKTLTGTVVFNDDILKITLDSLPSSGSVTAASKVWFEFYDPSNTPNIPVARAKGDPAVNNTGIASTSDNIYYLKLSDIDIITGEGLLVDVVYSVVAKIRYGVTSPPEFRDSDAKTGVVFGKTIPSISNNVVNTLYVANPDEKILTVDVKNAAYYLYAPKVSNGIRFHFYDESLSITTIHASTKYYSFVNNHNSTLAALSYHIKLSDISSSTPLINGVNYRVQAEVGLVKHNNGSETRLSALDNTTPISDRLDFATENPVINGVQGYDIQNDGEPDDSANQIVATVRVKQGQYELVAPNSVNGIRFLIYSDAGAETLIATTAHRLFVNNSGVSEHPYNVPLSDINLQSGQNKLVNGTKYYVKAEVTIEKHSGSTELRPSNTAVPVTFSQDVVPVSSVVISNTWALATDNNPTSSPSRFNASPPVGVSGYFNKTAQFDNDYDKDLDVTTTKYLLEYKLNAGSSWSPVTKAVLIHQGTGTGVSSSESLQEAVHRAESASVDISADGCYSNVVGDRARSIVFYIPQDQGSGNAFTEADEVAVRVTIIDTAGMWAGNNTSSETESNSLQVINKINSYDFSNATDSEPWNSQTGNQLVLNIPVDWNSIHAHSVKVGYKYSSGGSYTYETFNYDADSDYDYVSINVDPNQGPILYYSVAYIVKNKNHGVNATTQGLTVQTNVPNKFFPSSSDYTISIKSYKTFNTGGKSAVLFTVAFNAASTARIEGLHVYFNSLQQQTGSNVPSYCGESISHPEDSDITTMSGYFNSDKYDDDSDIPLKRIQSYTVASGGDKEIQLLYSDGRINLSSTGNFTPLRVMADNGDISDSTSLFWRDFDSANITFVAYRDRRVNTTGAAYNTVNHVESGSSDLGFPIWNVPKLQNPSFNGPIDLEGGVRNSSVETKLFWTSVYDMNGNPFKYDLTMMKNSTTSIHNETLTAGEKELIIDTSTDAKYTVTLKLVFAPSTTSAIRETSSADTITFETIHVNVSNVNISVQIPSDTSVVNLAWNEPRVSGKSITSGGSSVDATFNANIEQHYIKFSTTNPTNSLTRLAPSNSNPIERIVSPATKKQYSLPVTTLGALYSFFMHVAASIDYKVDTILHSLSNGVLVTPSASNSELKTTNPAQISDVTATTPTSQYVVSGIPVVTLPSQTPVLLTGQTTPTLLLGLNANGLESEGFISVLVILTQDGTASNPEGEHALLVFPNSGASFDYSNTISQSGGDARLAGGESTTSFPRNIEAHSMSTHNNQYTLTIGTIGGDDRYGHSTLQMPSSANSGFVDGDVNYMIILTTRRGVDVKTGMFTYQSLPSVRNVQIVTENGQYSVIFDIENA